MMLSLPANQLKQLSLFLPPQGAMRCISCSHTLSLLLCVLTLTPTSSGAGPETLCGAELVDTLQFVCGDRGFYFSKCTFLFIHKGWQHASQNSPPPAVLINKTAASLASCLDFFSCINVLAFIHSSSTVLSLRLVSLAGVIDEI